MMRKGPERKRKLTREDDRVVWEQTECSEDLLLRVIRAIRLVLQQPPYLALPKLCFHQQVISKVVVVRVGRSSSHM